MATNGDRPAGNIERTAYERPLASGRTLVVRADGTGEELEIRDRGGALELSISLTDDGPVVRLRAARIALESSDTISLSCRRFEVETTEALRLQTDGAVEVAGQEMRVRTASEIHLDGSMIRLNCDPPPAGATASDVVAQLDHDGLRAREP